MCRNSVLRSKNPLFQVRCIVAEKDRLANEASDRKTALRVLNEAMTQASEALR